MARWLSATRPPSAAPDAATPSSDESATAVSSRTWPAQLRSGRSGAAPAARAARGAAAEPLNSHSTTVVSDAPVRRRASDDVCATHVIARECWWCVDSVRPPSEVGAQRTVPLAAREHERGAPVGVAARQDRLPRRLLHVGRRRSASMQWRRALATGGSARPAAATSTAWTDALASTQTRRRYSGSPLAHSPTSASAPGAKPPPAAVAAAAVSRSGSRANGRIAPGAGGPQAAGA